MEYRVKYKALILLFYISILTLKNTKGTEWNSYCSYDQKSNEKLICYKVLKNGVKFNWVEAYDLCHRDRSHLFIASLIDDGREQERSRLLNDSDTWTAIRLVNGFLQEVTEYTDFSSHADALWETYHVWNEDLCVKVTADNKLIQTNCSSKLTVLCVNDSKDSTNQGDTPVCNDILKPTMTIKVKGSSVDVDTGHLEIKEEQKEYVTFYCDGLENKANFDWIKDGVYVRRHEKAIYLKNLYDPSKYYSENKKGDVLLYSIQGTYWCEAWNPGCMKKFSSNKVNLTIEGIVTIQILLEQTNSSVKVEKKYRDEIHSSVNKSFQLCGTKKYIESDVRYCYTYAGKNLTSTYSLNVYLKNYNTSCDVLQCIDEVKESLPNSTAVSHEVSFLSFCKKRQVIWGKSATNLCDDSRNEKCIACPKNYYLLNSYCVRVTTSTTWSEAYKQCFLTGIEKTPLDISVTDSDFHENLTCILEEQNINYIWVAAERKLSGGPFYYSGPVESNFSYSNMESYDYNVSKKVTNIAVNKNCLAYKLGQRKLKIVSCEDTLPFICLFPSVFWAHGITYDNFNFCNDTSSTCVENYKFKNGISWKTAEENCTESNGNLVLVYERGKASNINSYRYISNNIRIIGNHNTQRPAIRNPTNIQKPRMVNNLQSRFNQWFQNDKLTLIYDSFGKGLGTEISYIKKEYICLPNQTAIPQIYISEKNNGTYMINMSNTEEVNYAYGIKCYINGRIVKSDELNIFNVTQQGYLFCEVITHMPVLLLKSNVILVQDPDNITFVCEILDQNQTYNLKLHDFTFHNDSKGSIVYYEKLLKDLLKGFETYIYNITSSSTKSGIKIAFYTERSADRSKLSDIHRNITTLLPTGREIDLGNNKVTVLHVRNTRYCLEEKTDIIPNTTNCTNSATWPLTEINSENFTAEKCVSTCTGKALRRRCEGNFSIGAEWSRVEETSRHTSQILDGELNTCDVLEKAWYLINNTGTDLLVMKLTSSETDNITSAFVREFENLFFLNREVNETIEWKNDKTVSIYSSALEPDVLGYVYRNDLIKPFDDATKSLATKEDVIMTIYLNQTITSEKNKDAHVLISIFSNTELFPKRMGNLQLISAVALINISEVENIEYPVRILFTSEVEIPSGLEPVCVIWNETTNIWDNTSTRYDGTIKSLHQCLFYHFSSFALLLQANNKEHEVSLGIISTVGCCLSLIGLGLVLFTFLLFRQWRTRVDSKILASLSLSLFAMYLTFVTGFTHTSNKDTCLVIAIILHYFTLASFCWMFVEAYHNYLKYVKVFGTYIPRFIWKASAYAWGIPIIPIVSVSCYNSKLYISDYYCWIHSEAFYFALLAPLCIMWGANMIIFILIIISTTCKRQQLQSNQQKFSMSVIQLKMSLCVFVLLGLSWIFGFLSHFEVGGGVIFSYLFCITSTLQGFLIFVFFVLQERRAQNLWRALFYRYYTEMQQTSDTAYTSRTQNSKMDSSESKL